MEVKKAKKKPPNRSTNKVVYVYCTEEQLKLLKEAATKSVEDIPWAVAPLYQFVLQAALKEAKEIFRKGMT